MLLCLCVRVCVSFLSLGRFLYVSFRFSSFLLIADLSNLLASVHRTHLYFWRVDAALCLELRGGYSLVL